MKIENLMSDSIYFFGIMKEKNSYQNDWTMTFHTHLTPSYTSSNSCLYFSLIPTLLCQAAAYILHTYAHVFDWYTNKWKDKTEIIFLFRLLSSVLCPCFVIAIVVSFSLVSNMNIKWSTWERKWQIKKCIYLHTSICRSSKCSELFSVNHLNYHIELNS